MEQLQLKHGVYAYRSLKDLHKHPSNPRFIDDDDFKTLVASIKKNPDYFEGRPLILSDRTGELVIIAGNQRYDAATFLKIKEVPTFLMTGLTEEREKEIAIRDNINNGQWDWDILHSDEWNTQPLEEWGLPPAFDPESKVKDDGFEMPDEVKTDIVKGDLIEIGQHRLLCGDATKIEDVEKVMAGKKADMVFTDPPYNVNYGSVKNHPSWKRTKKGEDNPNPEAIKNDNLSEEDWSAFVRAYLANILKTCAGAIYICMSNKEMYSNQNTFIELGGVWSTFIIWKKDTFVLGMSDYQRQYEPILYGWKKGVTKIWCGDRKQSDIWEVDRPKSSPEHPTIPIELCGRAINNSSGNNNIIQDIFAGSGSTMVAAHQINRICYAMEIEPKYCQVIVDRMLKLDPTLKVKRNGKPMKGGQ